MHCSMQCIFVACHYNSLSLVYFLWNRSFSFFMLRPVYLVSDVALVLFSMLRNEFLQKVVWLYLGLLLSFSDFKSKPIVPCGSCRQTLAEVSSMSSKLELNCCPFYGSMIQHSPDGTITLMLDVDTCQVGFVQFSSAFARRHKYLAIAVNKSALIIILVTRCWCSLWYRGFRVQLNYMQYRYLFKYFIGCCFYLFYCYITCLNIFCCFYLF